MEFEIEKHATLLREVHEEIFFIDLAPRPQPAEPSPSQETQNVSPSSEPTHWPRPLLFNVTVIVLAYLPLLSGFAGYLWSREYYQFFPLLLIAAAVLGYDRSQNLGRLSPGLGSRAKIFATLAWLLLATGIFLSSHWLAAVSFLLMMTSCSTGLGGSRLTRALLPAFFVVAMVIPPPMGLDQKLASNCQTWATGWASQILDLFSVFHVREGNILELPNKRLLVEQACNGMNSLLPGMGVSVFLGLWFRRSLWYLLALVSGSAAILLFGNAARLATIGAAYGWWGTDLSEGTPHTILGLVSFVLCALFMISYDQLLSFFVRGSPLHLSMSVRILAFRGVGTWFGYDVAKRLQEAVKPPVEEAPAVAPTTRLADLEKSWLSGWFVLVGFMVLALWQGAILYKQYRNPARLRMDVIPALPLPAKWGEWELESDCAEGNRP